MSTTELTAQIESLRSLEELIEEAKAEAETLRDAIKQEMLKRVVQAINAKVKVGCTGCGYCMPCPRHVDIPGTFAAYNRLHTEGKFSGLKEYFMCTAARQDSTAASNCIGCGKCEQHCPQHIPIRQELKNAQKELEVLAYRLGRKLVKNFKLF